MYIKRILDDIRTYGLLVWFIYILNRIFTTASNKISLEHFYLFAIPISGDKKIQIPAFLKKSYQIKKIKKYHPFFDLFDTPLETIKFRLKQNTDCLLLSKSGEPVGFLWIAQKKYQEDIAFCDFIMENEIAWDFDVVIREKFRKTPAFAVLWNYTFNYLENKKVDWIYSRINAKNIQSLEVHKKFGGRITGTFIFIKFQRLQFCIDFINMKISKHRENSRKVVKLPLHFKKQSLGK